MSEHGQQEKDWRNKDFFDPNRHKENLDYARGAGLFAVFTLLGLGIFYFADKDLLGGYWTNIVSTVIGAVLTIVILDKRNDYRAEREFKERLILQMGSPDNGFAVDALRLLRQKGWATDGSLIGIHLGQSNLNRAYLSYVDLQMANLEGANFQHSFVQGANFYKADLSRANFQHSFAQVAIFCEAYLLGSNFQHAYLLGANLQNARLLGADFQGALLSEANLEKAWLSATNLKGANLSHAKLVNTLFDEHTILPDGSYWTAERDMREFTDPEIWQAEQAAKRSEDSDVPRHSQPPTPKPQPLIFEYIERSPRPRWRDM